jgi:hypothetical protein
MYREKEIIRMDLCVEGEQSRFAGTTRNEV